ncbi:hypothetical protein [Catenuloplanes indicus]|uniref:Uncharacterized protein n=1 Tax=Catenuloplanes indicus TaxID=137267 RepID=A0AAE3W5S8_9ACTN|nr:hypothetical protein [Catenuloplanes indicus]MDQ0370423.1 hypothetical protein [Catenuloplanes indicus]
MAVAPPPIPAIVPGTVLFIADERDYRLGVGPLALRVTALGTPGAEWLVVHGHRIGHDGRVDHRHLTFTIRVAALRDAVRPTGWLPPAIRQ